MLQFDIQISQTKILVRLIEVSKFDAVFQVEKFEESSEELYFDIKEVLHKLIQISYGECAFEISKPQKIISVVDVDSEKVQEQFSELKSQGSAKPKKVRLFNEIEDEESFEKPEAKRKKVDKKEEGQSKNLLTADTSSKKTPLSLF